MTYKATGAVAVRVRQGRQLLQVKAPTLEESKKLAGKLLEGLLGPEREVVEVREPRVWKIGLFGSELLEL